MSLRRHAVLRVARILVTVALLAVVFSLVNMKSVARVFENADPLLLSAAIAIGLCDRAVMILKWYPLLRVQVEAVSLWRAAKAYLASGFTTFFLPSSLGPDVVRAVAMGQQTGATAKVSASIIAERALGMVGAGFLNLIAIAVAIHAGIELAVVIPWALASVVVALIVLMAPNNTLLWRGLNRLAEAGGVPGRAGGILLALAQALRSYRERSTLLLAIVTASFAEQLIPVLALWVVSRALDLPVTLPMLLLAIPLSLFVERLPISIWSLGVAEGAFIYLLGLFGVTPAQALSLSFGGRLVEIASYLPGSLVWFELVRGRRAATGSSLEGEAGD